MWLSDVLLRSHYFGRRGRRTVVSLNVVVFALGSCFSGSRAQRHNDHTGSGGALSRGRTGHWCCLQAHSWPHSHPLRRYHAAQGKPAPLPLEAWWKSLYHGSLKMCTDHVVLFVLDFSYVKFWWQLLRHVAERLLPCLVISFELTWF